jgi:dimethylargininase
VFVQDPVLIAGGAVVRLRSAAPSRQGEADSLVEALGHYLPVRDLAAPATLDGGDVLVAEDCLYVGLSSRSNHAGCEQLQALTGLRVLPVALPSGLLHLLSGCTNLGHNRLLAVAALAPYFPEFDSILVPDAESAAANVLVVGRHAIVPAGYPRVAGLVAGCGFTVYPVPSSEFEKRDGGVTCRALVF